MYCVCWFDLDPIQGQGQGHGAFELPTTSEAVHAGGDDRSPLAGLSGLNNATNLHRLTSHGMLCCPTTQRCYVTADYCDTTSRRTLTYGASFFYRLAALPFHATNTVTRSSHWQEGAQSTDPNKPLSFLDPWTHEGRNVTDGRHTHTHLTASFPRQPQYAGTRKVKPF